MYSANLFEISKVQMAERQQQSMAAYRVRAMVGEQPKGNGLRRLIAAVRASYAENVRWARATPPPMSAAADTCTQQILV
jgi:hypothetical protein